jgi:hypothetical protein
MTLPSHDGDGAAKATWARHDVVPSHVGDGAIAVTWPWCDVPIESCWGWCCRGDLDVV